MSASKESKVWTFEDPSIDVKKLEPIIEEYASVPGSIITILQKAQEIFGYLPIDLLAYIADRTGKRPADILGIVTFYENFSLEPKGKYVIKICDGTACHVRDSIPILNRMRGDLNLTSETVTTEDMLFTVETVSCLGACGLAPVVTVNGKVYPSVTPDAASALLKTLKEENQNA